VKVAKKRLRRTPTKFSVRRGRDEKREEKQEKIAREKVSENATPDVWKK